MRSPATSASAPARSATPAGLRRIALAVAALASAAALAGCGSGGDASGEASASSEAEPVGEETAGSVAQLAQCRDWVGATRDQKVATIADIRSQVNLEDTGVDAPALSDAEALEVFNNACARTYAQGFRLYVIYARAAAFKPLRDIAEGQR